ncbi:thioredoxin-disulfide reductase [Symbiobacterium terraclitae]|uniref:thioredoxin-disulfide reductase n=1 Tax=Symbiobacterium terraclitae TaxID=557451 RepID=UPI0035B54406
MADRYDLVIVGGGPAGLTAAIYGARARMKTLLIEKGRTGGQAASTEEVENYPGAGRTTGPALMQQFRAHAESLGATIVRADVAALELDRPIKTIRTRKGDEYEARAVILAPGAEPRMQGVKGEGRFRGKGVSYCATCDADFYTDLDVVVVGNGDAAVEEAIYLTKFASSVTLICIHPEGTMDANKAAQERLFATPKIKVIWQSVVEEIQGDEIVTGVLLRNLATGEQTVLPCDGVFIFVGTVPRTEFLKGTGVELDGRGYIIADPDTMATSIDGVYAAGDARRKWLRQIVTAAADGAIAACAAEKFLAEEEQVNRDLLEPEEPVLAVFWSPAVPLSIEVLRQAEQVVAGLGGQMRLARIDCYKSARTANRLGVSDVPAIMLFHKGIPLATLTEDFNHLAEWVEGHIPART